MDAQQMHEVVRLATECSFNMVMELLNKQPAYTSRKDAKKKYKGLLELWERDGLIKAMPTEKAHHFVYPTHRLIELYKIWSCGR